jgi:hypothetical protein
MAHSRIQATLALMAATTLVACGGGGGTPAAPVVTPESTAYDTAFAAPTRTVGDEFTLTRVQTDPTGTITSKVLTRYTSVCHDNSNACVYSVDLFDVAPDGTNQYAGQTTKTVQSNNHYTVVRDDALGHALETDYFSTGGLQTDHLIWTPPTAGGVSSLDMQCSWSAGHRTASPFPIIVGFKPVDLTGTYRCSNAESITEYRYTSHLEVPTEETKVVDGISYLTRKVHIEETYIPMAGGSTAPTRTETSDCWWSPKAKREVLCDRTTSYSDRIAKDTTTEALSADFLNNP